MSVGTEEPGVKSEHQRKKTKLNLSIGWVVTSGRAMDVVIRGNITACSSVSPVPEPIYLLIYLFMIMRLE